MANRVHANNFVTTLNGDISSGATSIIITSATGFPTVGSGAVANVTLANGTDIEIVTCTARSGTTLTVVRGAEGTTPTAFVSGSTVSIRPTADSVDRKQDRDSYETTATAAGTTTLTVNSARDQFFTGSTTQTVVLPVVSTLALGRKFHIVNESSGVVTVQSSGANSIQAMAANTILDLECIAITGTGTASWYANYRLKDNSTGGGGSGDFVGPGSSTDNAVVRFDSTTGKLGQDSGVIIDDSNNITGATSVAATSYLKAGGNATAAGYIELLEDSDNGSNKVTITAPASIASDKTATLPDASGTFTLLGNSSTGSGNVVLATSPTLVTPALGTPSSGTLTNCTGLPITGLTSAPITQVTKQTFTSSGTYTPNANMIYAIIELVGGGGGGGGTSNTGAAAISVGAGGAGGGYARTFVNRSTVLGGGSAATVTVGGGGAGGTAGGNGSAGGSTSVVANSGAGSILAAATGGGAGNGAGAGGTSAGQTASIPGAGTTGDLITDGSPGGASFGTYGTGALGVPGSGGSSFFGGGAYGNLVLGNVSYPGNAGAKYGGGGSGGGNAGAQGAANGGAGSAGVVVITEYLSV